MRKQYKFLSLRSITILTLGFFSALLGADTAHRFWNPDLVRKIKKFKTFS
jgi:hypothetical protein